MDSAIPFNKPFADEIGQRYIAQALSSPKHSGDGPFTQRCHALLESALGVEKVLFLMLEERSARAMHDALRDAGRPRGVEDIQRVIER